MEEIVLFSQELLALPMDALAANRELMTPPREKAKRRVGFGRVQGK